ncbi:MAG: SpoIIE family protein phosphatase [Salinivirgaceae bacterium]
MDMTTAQLERSKQILAGAPLFEGTQGYQLETVIKASLYVRYTAGQIIFEKGDRANGFFIILEGTVKIHVRDIKFIELGTGKYFGEYALIANEPHSSTVTAIRDCECLVIPPDVFENLLQQSLPFSNRLLKTLIQRLRSKDELEISLRKKNTEINERNEKIRFQNQKIKIQNERIQESIEYAGMIQSTLLPSFKLLDIKLEDYFLIFHPKEKVSGDFYWFAQIENKYCIAISDCTGHGVPGSMISILGIQFLNEIINKIPSPDPGLILSKLNNKMQNALNQNHEKYHSHDGMDMSIIVIDFDSLQLSYAGAQSPMYIVRDGKLSIFEADKVSIGTAPHNYTFNRQDTLLDYHDMIYLYTDGIVDQFGGSNDSRYATKQLRNILLSVAEEAPLVQEQAILDSFMEWKGENAQTDDVTLLGVRI